MEERAADQCTNLAYARYMKEDYPEALRCYREAVGLYARSGCEEKRALAAANADRLEAALGTAE